MFPPEFNLKNLVKKDSGFESEVAEFKSEARIFPREKRF